MARASSEAQRRFIGNLARLLPLPLALAAGSTWAVKFDLVPTLVVEEEYTDNVALQPDALKRSEWATLLTPGFNFTVTGRDWRIIVGYGAEIVQRTREDSSGVNHRLNIGSVGSMELHPQLLYLDMNSNVSQQSISAFGPQAASNVNTTGNRATVRNTSISPYLRHNFGTDAEGVARWTYSRVASDASGFADSGANKLDLKLNSGPAAKLTTWSASYSKEVVDYGGGTDSTTANSVNQSTGEERLQLNAKRLITPTLGVIGSVGYEEYDYLTGGRAPKGSTWNLGFNWTPTPRTNVSYTHGKRYFGATNNLDVRHRMRLVTFSGGYSEDVTSTRSQMLLPSSASTADYLNTLFLPKIADPIARQEAVQAFITANGLPPSLSTPVEFLTNQYFLNKSWRAGIGFTGVRNTVFANYYNTTRESQQTGVAVTGSGDFSSANEIKMSGTSATWSWRVSQYDSSNMSLGYNRSEAPATGRDETYTFLRWSLTHQFDPRLHGVLSFRRLLGETNTATGNYTENAVTASLRMSF